MDRSLTPIREDDPHGSSEATSYEDLPTVTPIVRTFTDTIQKQNAENEALKKKILRLQATLNNTRDELNETTEALVANVNTPHDPTARFRPLSIPASPLGLTPRVPRPQDVAYQAALQDHKEHKALETAEEFKSEDGIMRLFSKLAQALTDNNNADVSTPPHFSGKDEEWETWYSQFRTYLKGKGWLDTFESTGPGSPDFNAGINSKIYNKLIILCGKGYALTYIQNAAEFDGLGAGRQLLARYDGFSKQRNRSLRKTIEQMRHTSGTSMSDHIDLFEKLCGQIASSGNPATEEEKLDWFIESVNEDTYASIKAHCNSLKILGTLQFAQMIKLYALTCFAKYPQFQLRALGNKDAVLTNNSTSFDKRGRKGKGKANNGKGKGRGLNAKAAGRGSQEKGTGNRPQKGRGKGGNRHQDNSPSTTSKGTSQRSTTYNKTVKFQGECNYCGIYGHQSRDCRKRLAAETKTSKPSKTNNSVTATQVTFDADIDDLSSSDPDDETTTMFQSAVTVDNESEDEDDASTQTDTEEEREYSIEIIEGVRYLTYHVVVPPDTPIENDIMSNGNANETQANNGNANVTQEQDNSRASTEHPIPVPDALQSSSVEPYTWGEGRFAPQWGRWQDRPIQPLHEDNTWGETTHKWERKAREKVITQGGSPPPKLNSATNLFVDGPCQHVPYHNQHASDDLAFRTGRRQDGIVSPVKEQQIPIHPNPFAPLQEPTATYNEFIHESDPEDHADPPTIREVAPSTPATPKPKSKRLRSFKEEDITSA